MFLKYDIEISDDTIKNHLKKITNQIYKLLPIREEGGPWELTLSTLIEEIVGMNSLFVDHQDLFFPLICKLEGLYSLTNEKDFFSYRRTIFECLNLLNKIKEECLD